jgi:Helitron helicase-like domain at N-terminus/AAA domain
MSSSALSKYCNFFWWPLADLAADPVLGSGVSSQVSHPPVVQRPSSQNTELSMPYHLDFLPLEMQPRSHVKPTVHRDGLNSRSLASELPKNAIHIRSSFLKRNTRVDSIKLIQTAPLHDLRAWCAGASLTPAGNRQHKSSFIVPLVDRFWQTFLLYHEMDLDALHICAAAVSSRAVSRDGCIYDLLQSVFPLPFLRKLLNVRAVNVNAFTRNQRNTKYLAAKADLLMHHQLLVNTWPQIPDPLFVQQRCKDYVKATSISPRRPCICCGRSFLFSDLAQLFVFSLNDPPVAPPHPLCILQANRSERHSAFPFSSSVPALEGLWIFHAYALLNAPAHTVSLPFCAECSSSLTAGKLPRFSLKNNLFRGVLPPEFSDLSWIEEKVCALHRVTADVVRLHYLEQDDTLPFRMVGNTCAHPANVPSIATVLPRMPADVNGHLTVVFVGKKFDKKKLPPLFRVRRSVITKFLHFLSQSNPLYANVTISEEALAEYPEDDILPLLMESIIITETSSNHTDHVAAETASFETHPANPFSLAADNTTHIHATSEDDEIPTIIESTGAIDFDGTAVSGHSSIATAVFNLLRPRRDTDLPDILLPRGEDPISEYDNPTLLPGMFPTLFPFGSGAPEGERPVRISLQEHANYLLSLHDTSFCYHRLFLFVVLNILKRRKGHLQTSFTVRKPSFDSVADMLASVTAETLESTALHLQNNGSFAEMSPAQQEAFACLKQLNIVSSKLPGSPAAKIGDRVTMRGYFGILGLPLIYLTLNPSPAHSPIIQVFFGDKAVNLAEQFPSLPLPAVRAKRIAQDPVAAADFFVFSIKMFFQHLLGYDMDSRTSTGGILGHVKAYYGKCECTMRGCLHAHFVIWLTGGLNPCEVHERLEHDEEFKLRFFSFWEAVIKHDAPYPDMHVEPDFEPRTQRPPPITEDDWDATFQLDVKRCAEKLQRHTCQEVCWKYKNVSHLPLELRPCRFQFPHEVEPQSYYDPSTKSVVMACRDPTMNFYNPHILVFCRHNHDIKNILSGRSAKAAMFYITNYMTKDDLHSHHMLTMMSQSIAHMTEDPSASPVDRAKSRLHRWLSQLARLQETHAQQAVLHIRGIDDTFKSHETVVLLSYTLLMQVRILYPERMGDVSQVNPSAAADDGDDNEYETTTVPLRRSPNGMIYTDATQVDDYLHRSLDLLGMSFFEFVCCIQKERLRTKASSRLGTFPRYCLLGSHPQHATHCLVQFQDPSLPLDLWKLVPRIVGMQVPRKESSEHSLFMIAHFKPFSISNPLIINDETYTDAFQRHSFSPMAVTVMRNWEDIHECEDERDADRMRKKQNQSSETAELNSRLAAYELERDGDDGEEDALFVDLDARPKAGNQATLRIATILREAGWFAPVDGPKLSMANPVALLDRPSDSTIKLWKKEVKTQEENMRRQRMNSANSQTQLDYSTYRTPTTAPQAILATALGTSDDPFLSAPAAVTSGNQVILETPEQLIQRIGKEMTLNEEQWVAYLIVARKFVNDMTARQNGDPVSPPLRLLLTGPGGTGKSHVVNTLKKLMATYGVEHKLRLLAPTGSAAGVIDATTIHKGLGIQVRRNKGNETDTAQIVASIGKKKRLQLEMEWADAEYIFCDECSMLGATLNAEFDQMLRLIKRVDDFYGGANVLFAGDFGQYPPVKATALYRPIGLRTGSKDNKDFLARLGRLAWKSIDTVVELTVQNRMKGDLEYAAAVGRLRLRQCTREDVVLFNSRLLKSPDNPDGVSLTQEESCGATTIVRKNDTRMYLNGLKATSAANKGEVVMCAARDYHQNGQRLEGDEKERHLLCDFSSTASQGGLPSLIPLAVGMQVILRQKNISPELKIANGSRGVIVALYTSKEGSYTSADGAVVHFAGSPIRLADLPPGCIYLEPHSISYRVSSGRSSKGFKRKQMQIEPAYAVTGHYSQGKTLPFVLTDLMQGGHAAYVAASRPTARTGMFLMERVTLRDLNFPPLPADLLKELRRLDALKHNTLVRYGFSQAEEVSVPDPEREMGFCDADNESLAFAVTSEPVERSVSIPSEVRRSCRSGLQTHFSYLAAYYSTRKRTSLIHCTAVPIPFPSLG